ncbi:MAG: hypothetical protein GX879_01335 [Bacteroidales bacterium]|nr:hypothetical protein [Bacteroidales bacterium]
MRITKAERFYRMMRKEAIRGYKHFGHWDWTMTQYWAEDETRNVIKEVNKMVNKKYQFIEINKKLKIYDDEKYQKEIEINNQIKKFVNERKRILEI